MLTYPDLTNHWSNQANPDLDALQDYLVDQWINDYVHSLAGSTSDIVEVSDNGFNYLFDIKQERLIAAWGISGGKNSEPRPKSRMKRHPLGGPKGYHRGHAIAHSLGGGTDINLVPQKGSINVGPFKVLEQRAVATPGSLYFSYWEYKDIATQRPAAVQQGLLIKAKKPEFKYFPN